MIRCPVNKWSFKTLLHSPWQRWKQLISRCKSANSRDPHRIYQSNIIFVSNEHKRLNNSHWTRCYGATSRRWVTAVRPTSSLSVKKQTLLKDHRREGRQKKKSSIKGGTAAMACIAGWEAQLEEHHRNWLMLFQICRCNSRLLLPHQECHSSRRKCQWLIVDLWQRIDSEVNTNKFEC